jgi:hypothetical protein
MNNFTKRFGVIAMAAVIGFMTFGCTTTDLKTNMAGEYNKIPKIAGKDFDILGHITVTATETVVVSALSLETTVTGERITYDMLLQEAKKVYPGYSDIINIRIDKIEKGKKGPFLWLTGGTTTVDYLGNALAIRYTKALDEGHWPVWGDNGDLPRGGAGDSIVDKFLDMVK